MSFAVNVDSLLTEFEFFPLRYLNLLDNYCRGDEVHLSEEDFNLATIHVSPFVQNVLRTVCDVGYGKTITYGQLAQMAGCPKAIRAVASALGKNPLPVIIPCHRVLAKNGLGGYAFGLELKKKLLEFEQNQFFMSLNRQASP